MPFMEFNEDAYRRKGRLCTSMEGRGTTDTKSLDIKCAGIFISE